MKDKRELIDYLQDHRLMQIATVKGEKPWICNVFYTVDNKLNLFFISKPTRRHCLEISKNKNVACAITDSHQKVTDKKKGLQIEGIASLLKNEKEIKFALDLWNKTNPGFEKIINLENFKKRKMEDKVYKIIPTEIKVFNEEMKGTTKVVRIR